MEEEELKTYIFMHKNSSVVITLSDVCFDNAGMQLHDLGLDVESFRCENKDGKDE